jgi:TPR repeat protein
MRVVGKFLTRRYIFLLAMFISLPCWAGFDVLAEPRKCDASVKEKGQEILMQQAISGEAFDEFCMGYFSESGKGLPKNHIDAAKWYERSAIHGYPAAGVYLGQMYERGDGVLQNDQLAVKWYRVSAELGDAWGQSLLGDRLIAGSFYGLEENPVEAAKWLHKSLEGGYWGSGEYLGWQYKTGNGVPKNLVVGHALILFNEILSSTLIYRSTISSTHSAKEMNADQKIQAEALAQKMRAIGVAKALNAYFSQHADEYCPQSMDTAKEGKRYYAFSHLCE